MLVSSCLPHKRAFSHVCDGCFLIEFLHRNRSLPSPMAHSTRCAISSSPDLYIFSASLHSCISLLLLFPVTSSAGHFFSTLRLLCSRFSPVHFFSSLCFRSSLFISVNTNNDPLACMQFPLARVVKQDMDGRRSVYLSIWLHGRVRCTNKQCWKPLWSQSMCTQQTQVSLDTVEKLQIWRWLTMHGFKKGPFDISRKLFIKTTKDFCWDT